MLRKTTLFLTAFITLMLAGIEVFSEPLALENLRGRQAVDPDKPIGTKPPPAPTKDCVDEFKTEILIKCNYRLQPGDVIFKKLVVEGETGITIDCNGAILNGGAGTLNDEKDMIEVRSKRLDDKEEVTKSRLMKGEPINKIWRRASGITIRDCNIVGSMRIFGMGKNGEAELVRFSSRMDGNHAARARAAAPTRITLQNLKIISTKRTPLYLAPGVTHVTLIGSELRGNAERTAIYLDAESGYNTIRDNYIHVKVFDEVTLLEINRLGPQISIDTSSYNKIINNRFAALEGGGIYTFRNCGEGGTIRHGSSSNNQIINNVFFYDKYLGFNPAIHIGSRGQWWRQLGYCGQDENRDVKRLLKLTFGFSHDFDNSRYYDPSRPEGKFPWGSSASDDDHSKHNIVMQNQIYKRPVDLMIRQGDSSNRPNLIAYNETVKEAEKRPAGCHISNGLTDFLKHGETSDLTYGADGIPRCTGKRLTCNDGRLSGRILKNCRVQRQSFECEVTWTNSGCHKQLSCLGKRLIVAARAVCNLEGNMVSLARVQAVPGNMISVVRPSDNESDGKCWVAKTSVRKGIAKIIGVTNQRKVDIGCVERDSNGGDCHIRGVLYCH